MLSVELITCAGCGEKPKFQKDRITYGQGDCPIIWFVVCKCGMRTKEIPQQYDVTEEKSQQRCAEIWNMAMAREISAQT